MKIKKFLFVTLLMVVVVCSTNQFKDFMVQNIYNPTPHSLTSPWPWKNDEKIHPVIDKLTPNIEVSIESVAKYIYQNEPDPFLRIKAIHDYVISRVTYDLDVLKTGIRPKQDAQTVFSTRKAVCEGYARLFMALVKEIGVDVVYIGGRVRQDLVPADVIPIGLRFKVLQSDYDWTLHAWNAVKIAGNWELVDTTWDDSQEPSSYITDYLMPLPEAMITSHLPEQSSWQLLQNPKDEDSFEKQLILTPRFFMEKLQIISPVDYPATVTKTALIEIQTTPKYSKKIVASFIKTKGSVFSIWDLPENKQGQRTCEDPNKLGETIRISCQFPEVGDYDVILWNVDDKKRKVDRIGQLKFHAL